jgi:hypothetical protein
MYLNTPFFLARQVLYFAVWIVMGTLLTRWSAEQDRTGDPALLGKLSKLSGGGLVVYGYSMTFAMIDWTMSVNPHWFSTIWGLLYLGGQGLSAMAFAIVVLIILSEAPPLNRVITEHHLHDLGKLLFAFSTFWAYIWVSQYLLIWYGNLPEEVTHYLRRTGPQWIFLFLMNLVVNWVLPFVALSTRAAKRSPRVLAAVCVALLLGRWLDLYLVVMPETVSTPTFGIWEALIPLGYVGLFCFLIARALAQAPLLPIGDPFLEESLHHHQ